MTRASLTKLLVLYTIIAFSANLVHPVTPMLLTNLKLPAYAFGVVFAGMSFTNFLFSPFWGKLSDMIGRKEIFFISLVGYALGQFVFMKTYTLSGILFARLIAGIFAGGFLVCAMAYISDVTDDENRGKAMSYFAAITSIGTALGFLAGGLLGSYSLYAPFTIQIFLLCTLGILFIFLFKEENPEKNEKHITFKELWKNANPIAAFIQGGKYINISLGIFLFVVFIANFAFVAYETSFNYYIREQFNSPPSYNGIIKAVVGIIGLVANFTINIWIVRRTNMRKSLIYILFLSSFSLLTVVFMDSIPSFILMNMIFSCFVIILLPILQTLMTMNGTDMPNGIVAGIFNSLRALGMILGSVFAGFIYVKGSLLPFIFSALAFFIAAIFCIINFYQFKKIQK